MGISLSEKGAWKDGFKLAPNPVVNQLNIYWESVQIFSASLKMLDLTGRLVWEMYRGEFYGQKFSSDLPNFVENGAYWLVVKKDIGDLLSQKILISC